MRLNIIILIAALLITQQAYACETTVATPLKLISLATAIPIDWQNEAKKPKSRILALPVYYAPGGEVRGYIIINFTPDKGLSAKVTDRVGREKPYVPTVFDADYGYGPWFHATLLDSSKSWYRIALPLLQSGWIHQETPDIYSVRDEKGVVSLKGQNYVILKSTDKTITVRDEQPSDRACDAKPAPLKNFETRTFNIKSLYNDRCELRIVPAYLRGC